MDIEGIDNTIALIEKCEPDNVQMRAYWLGPEDQPGPYLQPMCGYPACLAGFALLANKHKFDPAFWNSKLLIDLVDSNVAMVLGCTREQADQIALMSRVEAANIHIPAMRLDNYINIKFMGGPLDTFDRFPPLVRKQAAIELLKIMKHEGKVDWLSACDTAVTWFLFREQENLADMNITPAR